MVRIAKVEDAGQLERLNNAFNGTGETTLSNIQNSLVNNKQEIVIVAEENGVLVAFLCVQLKKSFCYDNYMPEITEVYVKPEFRRRGTAKEMLDFAENHCKEHFPYCKLELLTGKNNLVAQTVYGKCGFAEDGELHLSKRI